MRCRVHAKRQAQYVAQLFHAKTSHVLRGGEVTMNQIVHAVFLHDMVNLLRCDIHNVLCRVLCVLLAFGTRQISYFLRTINGKNKNMLQPFIT